MVPSIAFVGTGPTCLYTLAGLLARADTGFRIALFEDQAEPGLGSPYRPGWNDPAMLSNIASIEIPPLCDTLVEWMQRQSATVLLALGIDPDHINERSFVPRIALGQYFRDQFDDLVRRGRESGLQIDVHTRSRVIDVANRRDGILLTVAMAEGDIVQTSFDYVVLATGHQWPSQQETRPGHFLSPWPASSLSAIAPVRVGIRGSSLTAVDTAVMLAGLHGEFVRAGDDLVYLPNSDTEYFSLTMMSRKGLLPEADFFFPLPHIPLTICTPEAVKQLLEQDHNGLLEAVFELFKRELTTADPDYAASLNLHGATVESFADQYFADRASTDPFVWARANLAEARANLGARVTVAWRYAILRMHEVVAVIIPHLDDHEYERFNRYLKPVFVDNYGAVPHESIDRMLALHQAEKLEILALGDDYKIDTHRPEGGAVLYQDTGELHFPVFVEATGQKALSALQFPFLTLLEQGIVRDGGDVDVPGKSRGIMVDDQFRPIAEGRVIERLFCLGLPFIMGRHPFAQGITSSYEMGEIVGEALARVMAVKGDPTNSTPAEAA